MEFLHPFRKQCWNTFRIPPDHRYRLTSLKYPNISDYLASVISIIDLNTLTPSCNASVFYFQCCPPPCSFLSDTWHVKISGYEPGNKETKLTTRNVEAILRVTSSVLIYFNPHFITRQCTASRWNWEVTYNTLFLCPSATPSLRSLWMHWFSRKQPFPKWWN